VNSKRRLVSLIALVLVASVLVASVLYSSSGPSTPRTDPLILNGRTPHSMELSLALSTGGSLRTSGILWIDAANSTLSATLQVPVLTADTEFDVRALGHRLYFTSPNLANATGPVWYVQPLQLPKLSALGHLFLQPSVALLTLLANARIIHHGFFTTYEMNRSNVSLGTFSPKVKSAKVQGNLDLTITTGRQGEFTALWARLTSTSDTTIVSLHVLSFNPRVSIIAPPASHATTPAGPLLSALLKSGALGSLVLPTQLLQLLSHAKLS
jgi:hypothetical protein